MSRSPPQAADIEQASDHAIRLMNEFAVALSSAEDPSGQRAAVLGWLHGLDMLLADLGQLPGFSGLKTANFPLELLQVEMTMVRGGSSRDIFKPLPPQRGQQRALDRNQMVFLRACFLASDAYMGAGDKRLSADKNVAKKAASTAAAYGVTVSAASLPHQRKRYGWTRWQPPTHWTAEGTKRWADAMLQNFAMRKR